MSLDPETTSWVRALLAQEIDKAVAPLRQELDQVDDWANGVFAALSDLLLPLLKKHPEIAQELQPLWQGASEQYDKLEGVAQADDFHETQYLLEARKMLYRKLSALQAWPAPAQES